MTWHRQLIRAALWGVLGSVWILGAQHALAQDEAVASIEIIRVKGKEVERAPLDRARRLRPQAAPDTARQALALFEKDQLKTFSRTQLKVRFYSDEEQLLFLDANQDQTILTRNEIALFGGKVLANIKGIFKIRTPHAVLGVEGTRFALEVTSSQTRLVVVEDSVSYIPVRNEDAGRDTGLSSRAFIMASMISAEQGQGVNVRRVLPIRNRCAGSQNFRINSATNLPWVHIASDVVSIPGGTRLGTSVSIDIDAAAVDFGLYRAVITVDCLTCSSDPTCREDRSSSPLLIEVFPARPALVGAGGTITVKKGKVSKRARMSGRKIGKFIKPFDRFNDEKR